MLYEFNDTLISVLNYSDKMEYVKRLVRVSKEYKEWVKYIYSQFSLIKSPELNMNDIKDVEISCEVHHIIFLDSIVNMVCMKYLLDNTDKTLTAHQLADMVIQLHLDDQIPCVVLPVNIHEKLHMNLFKLSKDMSGMHLGSNINKFINTYKEYMSEDEIKLLKDLGVTIC